MAKDASPPYERVPNILRYFTKPLLTAIKHDIMHMRSPAYRLEMMNDFNLNITTLIKHWRLDVNPAP